MGLTVSNTSWFLCPESRPDAALRLFCLPSAGAGASMYRTWSSAFPGSIEVRAVQLPGRESRMREPRIVNAGLLAGEIAQALDPYLQHPFALFGYSMGALLAFEVVRELRLHGAPLPVCLFVAAMRAPDVPEVHPPLSGLPRAQFIDRINYYYQPSDPAWRIQELLELLLPILRDDISMVERYEYSTELALDCPIHAYAGADDSAASVSSVEAWQAQTAGDFTMTVFPGGHFFLHSVLPELQEAVRSRLTALLDDGRQFV